MSSVTPLETTTSPTSLSCGAAIPSQPTWICRSGTWEAIGDQIIRVNYTDITAPVFINGSLNVTNPDAVIIVHYYNRSVLNVTGAATLQGTLIVETMNISSLNDRTVIGYIGNLTRPLDVVNVPSLLDHCVKPSLDYDNEDLSMGILLRPNPQCRSSRRWMVPLIVVGK